MTTRVHAADGTLLAEFARERRLFQRIGTIPKLVINAFLSAEDKDFYTHGGIDFFGVIRAARDNVMAKVEGGLLVGASTITQQVAKNFLRNLPPDVGPKDPGADPGDAHRVRLHQGPDPRVFINEIFLGTVGGQTYGVAAASLNYFGKALSELNIWPKWRRSRPCQRRRAIIIHSAIPSRRSNGGNRRIHRMVENGFATVEEGETAKASPLGVGGRRAQRLIRRSISPRKSAVC